MTSSALMTVAAPEVGRDQTTAAPEADGFSAFLFRQFRAQCPISWHLQHLLLVFSSETSLAKARFTALTWPKRRLFCKREISDLFSFQLAARISTTSSSLKHSLSTSPSGDATPCSLRKASTSSKTTASAGSSASWLISGDPNFSCTRKAEAPLRLPFGPAFKSGKQDLDHCHHHRVELHVPLILRSYYGSLILRQA